jgi:hypothetical protein
MITSIYCKDLKNSQAIIKCDIQRNISHKHEMKHEIRKWGIKTHLSLSLNVQNL